MIKLSAQLCNELDISYWQLNTSSSQDPVVSPVVINTINKDEKELLIKILLAKGVSLNDNNLEMREAGIAIVTLGKYQLIFDDVSLPDNNNVIHLAKIAAMLQDPEQKKHTWFKLKNIDL